MIFLKAVTQNPKRKATRDDIGSLNTDEVSVTQENLVDSQMYVFPEGFARPVPQITDYPDDLNNLFKLKEGASLPYPTSDSQDKAELTTLPDKKQMVDIINRGLVAIYSAALLQYANEEKKKAMGTTGAKRGRGPVNLKTKKLV